MYLVVVSGAFDDVPVRLFRALKEAKAYAKQRWDSKENEATEELYKDAWDASQSASLPAINEIAGVRILRFRDGVLVGCVCHISGRVKSGNVG